MNQQQQKENVKEIIERIQVVEQNIAITNRMLGIYSRREGVNVKFYEEVALRNERLSDEREHLIAEVSQFVH